MVAYSLFVHPTPSIKNGAATFTSRCPVIGSGICFRRLTSLRSGTSPRGLSHNASVFDALGQRLVDGFHGFFGVAEKHVRVVIKEERVLHAGVTGTHGALGDNHFVGFPYVHNGHAGDG